MEIVYCLPFPKEICEKILYLGCQSSLTDLGIGVLKHFAYIDELDPGLPDQDEKLNSFNSRDYTGINILKPIDIFKFGRFSNLKRLFLFDGVIGDIQVFQHMTSLVELRIFGSDIFGDIQSLSSLKPLQHLSMQTQKKSLWGNINCLSKLSKLTYFLIYYSNITGEIMSLKMLPKLTYLGFVSNCIVDKEKMPEFIEFRSKNGFPKCALDIHSDIYWNGLTWSA